MKPDDTKDAQQPTPSQSSNFPIIAIGAAAGGDEALAALLQHLPSQTGGAYVFVSHEEASAESILRTLLAERIAVPTQEAKEGLKLAPDHLYLLSPVNALTVTDSMFKTLPEQSPYYTHLPVNRFFLALAEDEKDHPLVGVLLSGNTTDGALGLKAIKLATGFTFAQDDTARFQTMPKNAISEGAVDRVLPPQQLASELSKFSSQTYVFQKAISELDSNMFSDGDENLQGILQLLLRATGVDFARYKMNTIKRRIVRRMMLYKIESPHDYLSYLRQNINEVNFLYQDLLINVTSFFRDEETTEYLKKNILPKIIQTKSPNEPIRVWVPACSTGQEAYSLAMLIIETLGENASNIPIQIFATDLSETAVKKARLGIYSKDEVASISPKRLQRFFSKPDGSYRISKGIRDLCVFAIHNIAKDPPFTRLDLISCCNLMIYLDTPLQKKIIATFHYALNNSGYLVLGKSETVGASGYLFSQVDKGVKIYTRKKEANTKAMFEIAYRTPEATSYTTGGNRTASRKNKNEELDLEEAVNNLLLKRFTPASVLVNYDLDILQFRGATGLYLEPSPGKASLNLMKMAKPGLGFELRNVVHKAKKTGQPVKKQGLDIIINDKMQHISIEAIPMKTEAEEEFFLVVFEEMPAVKDPSEFGNVKDLRVKQLEAELAALREDMRAIVEVQEAANEELQSANEEIVSSNEELQSINEELETSKEEIESSNEELITINQELQIRNEQLAESQEYSNAILDTISEAVIVLDRNLVVRSANKSFYETFAVREEDTEARSIYDLGNRQWNIPQLREVLEEIIPKNTRLKGFEVTHNFSGIGEKTMRLNARRVIHMINRQEAILLTIEDITEYRQAQKIIGEREAWFRNMADNAPVMIWVTGVDTRCTFLNKAFLQFRGISLEEATGKSWAEDAHPEDVARVTEIYQVSFAERKEFELTYRLRHSDGSYRTMLTKAKPNYTTEGAFAGFIGSCVELDEKVKEAAKN